jgi:hypothetical protein
MGHSTLPTMEKRKHDSGRLISTGERGSYLEILTPYLQKKLISRMKEFIHVVNMCMSIVNEL